MSDTEPEEHPPVAIDPRPRQLLEKYASLAGTLLLDMGDGLVEFEAPAGDRKSWGAATVRLALVPGALEEDPEAELLTIGSPAFERLVAAVRGRGFLESNGVIPPTEDPSPEAAVIPVPLEGVTAGECRTELTLLPVGRLLARVSIKAGPWLEERLVESPLVDLASGTLAPTSLTEALNRSESGAAKAMPSAVTVSPRRDAAALIPLLFDELEQELRPEIERVRQEADRALRSEVDRLERYYTAMVDEVEAGDEPGGARGAKEAIRAEMARRKDEEQERYRVRVTVHPIQLREWQVAAQRASWRLTTPTAHTGELTARRFLTGETSWQMSCPSCGAVPQALRVCAAGHVSCPGCSERCGVCSATACRTHGLTTCAAEGHPVCAEHARTCPGCGGAHCTAHSAHCTLGDHEVCPSCAARCGRCGVELCRIHGTRTGDEAPRGARWLCGECTVLCEAGSDEPVGLDEAVRCSSCDRHICTTHATRCAVDGQPHCSRHLRRSDRSGRLACEEHRASCEEEPASVLASDEVGACVTCGKGVCDQHAGLCEADSARHCNGHLSALADKPGQRGCESHRTRCHLDGVTFSMTGTRPCPVCDKPACEGHRAACGSCARQVCVRDVEEGKCLTCRRLEEIADPADDLIQAALAANGGEPPKARGWRTARDASGTVVELDLGWTRRLVFTVPHGELKPKTVVQHNMLGSKRVR